MQYINRAITSVLIKRLAQSKCVLVTGARQVGKSTLLNHELPNYTSVTFDNREERRLAREDPGIFFLNNKPPIIIDEVQKESEILEDIKLIIDKSERNGNFVLSGSQSLEIMKGTSESLAGRVSLLKLSGLSMREIYNIDFNKRFLPCETYLKYREDFIKNCDELWSFIFMGGYPELYSSNREWEDFFTSYVNTYIERDINELIASDSVTFMKFMCAIASRTGELLNYASLSRAIGVSVPTIKTWISLLERTGIINLIQPYCSNMLKRAIKSPKIYFQDTGLACYLAGWNTQKAVSNSAVAGSMFETFVVNEIIKSYINEGIDYKRRIFYYRGKDKNIYYDNEIDLIIEENGTLYPIEIKMTSKPTAKMASANEILRKIDNKKIARGTILCLCDKMRFLSDSVLALPVSYI